ncbi:hypothetical protein BD289DRAFT_435620 [Coniella lustricola]|uniref:Uncharacterized protein n=1 Tax=Coniella lustricola TaxID=2025994 RepID=A0A2T3A668_9PEZI|nr:hypothetical protein BD289DRAFT_435620 [Coniella lustricola]
MSCTLMMAYKHNTIVPDWLTRDTAPSNNSETHPSVQTVSLIGSWDNFSKLHTMERDSRRDWGQWRGCHTFKDIVCDGDSPAPSRRNGGLKMGQPYYFYYELDGSHETHDPSRPSTSACPYLPGQTVNIMVIPAEKPRRKRRASLSSMNDDDFMTMDPDDRYLTPRKPPVLPAIPDFLGPRHRLPTSPSPSLKHKISDRSLPSASSQSWWSPKKLFTRKHTSTSSQGSVDSSASSISSEEQQNDALSSTSESQNTRAMDPESLRRFLMDGAPATADIPSSHRLELSIPDELPDEDDDDFVPASTISEYAPKTILSPPPPSSSYNSPSTVLQHMSENGSAVTLKGLARTSTFSPRFPMASSTFYEKSTEPSVEADQPVSRFSFSSDECAVYEEPDANSYATDNDTPSFYFSDAEDDDDMDYLSPLRQPTARDSMEQHLTATTIFEAYRLPRTSMDLRSKETSTTHNGSAGTSISINSPPLLALPATEDFVSELKSAGLSF